MEDKYYHKQKMELLKMDDKLYYKQKMELLKMDDSELDQYGNFYCSHKSIFDGITFEQFLVCVRAWRCWQ